MTVVSPVVVMVAAAYLYPGGGISTLYASITWDKNTPTTDPPASDNEEIGRPVVLTIGCATTTQNAS